MRLRWVRWVCMHFRREVSGFQCDQNLWREWYSTTCADLPDLYRFFFANRSGIIFLDEIDKLARTHVNTNLFEINWLNMKYCAQGFSHHWRLRIFQRRGYFTNIVCLVICHFRLFVGVQKELLALVEGTTVKTVRVVKTRMMQKPLNFLCSHMGPSTLRIFYFSPVVLFTRCIRCISLIFSSVVVLYSRNPQIFFLSYRCSDRGFWCFSWPYFWTVGSLSCASAIGCSQPWRLLQHSYRMYFLRAQWKALPELFFLFLFVLQATQYNLVMQQVMQMRCYVTASVSLTVCGRFICLLPRVWIANLQRTASEP